MHPDIEIQEEIIVYSCRGQIHPRNEPLHGFYHAATFEWAEYARDCRLPFNKRFKPGTTFVVKHVWGWVIDTGELSKPQDIRFTITESMHLQNVLLHANRVMARALKHEHARVRTYFCQSVEWNDDRREFEIEAAT